MSFSNAAETAILELLLNGTTFDGWAQNDTTSPYTNVYVVLHTADPGEAGTAATNEAAYTGYTRVPVARTSGGWTVTGPTATNTATVTFGTCTASPGSPITHASLTGVVSGASVIIASGALTASYQPAIGNAPQFSAGQLSLTLD